MRLRNLSHDIRWRPLLIVPVLALLLVLALALGGCGESGPADESGTQAGPGSEETETVSVEIARQGATGYSLVRSDLSGSADADVKSMVSLRRAIEEKLGVLPDIYTDYIGVGGTDERECEILVGNTNRPQSAQCVADLEAGTWRICMAGKKLVLVSDRDVGLVFAVDYLIEHYVKQSGFSVPENLDVRGNYSVDYTFTYQKPLAGSAKYDDIIAVTTLQGLYNRQSGNLLYVLGGDSTNEWFGTFTKEDGWLKDRTFESLNEVGQVFDLVAPLLKCAVIWDTNVPATVNVATTVAGVEDGVVLTRESYDRYKSHLPADLKIISLEGKFDGSVTGSAKNDAYRWALHEYLEKGLCSKDFICYYVDSFYARNNGDTAYISLRDWSVYNRAFVVDLSPWGDETPFDDRTQKVGTDLETLKMILQTQKNLLEGKSTFEFCGFFNFTKYSKNGDNTESKHDPVPTEWETVYVISPYGGYQNTATEWCWNQSVHSKFEGGTYENNRPDEWMTLDNSPQTVYLSFFMADYDSTYPLYTYLQRYWKDPMRGKIPLAWGINPNLADSVPDVIDYYYRTKTENDYFTSDASAAGYFNPSRIPSEMWDMVTEHNREYFEKFDMTIAPMVLDWDKLGPEALEAFSKFSYDGLATIIIDFHGNGGKQAAPFLYEDTMVCDQLYNNFSTESVDRGAEAVNQIIRTQAGTGKARFGLVRCVWTSPTFISEVIEEVKAQNPNLNIEVVDIYNYFELRRQQLSK